MNNEKTIIKINEKIKNNPKYLHPCNKEFQDDIKRFEFKNGNEFVSWMQQNGILKKSADITRKKNDVTAKNYGFDSWAEYQFSLAIKKGFANTGEYRDHLIKKKGFRSTKEYQDYIARKKGYNDHNEYQRKELNKYKANWTRNYRHEKGIQEPMEFNENCTSNFGVYKGEMIFKRFLEHVIFECVENTVYRDGGIDFKCRNSKQEFINRYPQFKLDKDKEYKIQLKMRCLISHNGSIQWIFNIGYNNKPDYFILAAWDNRDDLNPLHIWLFHKDDIIRTKALWMRSSINIVNKPEKLLEFCNNELDSGELEKLKQIKSELLEKY